MPLFQLIFFYLSSLSCGGTLPVSMPLFRRESFQVLASSVVLGSSPLARQKKLTALRATLLTLALLDLVGVSIFSRARLTTSEAKPRGKKGMRITQHLFGTDRIPTCLM